MDPKRVKSRERIGVFGGTFDPVHLGHLIAAQDAWEQMKLDRVVFMPTARAPLKDRAPGTTGEARLRLLRAAIDGEPHFAVSTMEMERGGVSYTIDTARELRRQQPDADFFWVIGTDQARRLGEWRDAEELTRLIEFIVLARPGYARPEQPAPSGLRVHFITAHVFDISSSEIRDRLASGRPVRAFLPAPVADLIEREHLYR